MTRVISKLSHRLRISRFTVPPGRDLNSYSQRPRDFKSLVSTDSTTRASGNQNWRRVPESNRGRRICNPLHGHSANAPYFIACLRTTAVLSTNCRITTLQLTDHKDNSFIPCFRMDAIMACLSNDGKPFWRETFRWLHHSQHRPALKKNRHLPAPANLALLIIAPTHPTMESTLDGRSIAGQIRAKSGRRGHTNRCSSPVPLGPG